MKSNKSPDNGPKHFKLKNLGPIFEKLQTELEVLGVKFGDRPCKSEGGIKKKAKT